MSDESTDRRVAIYCRISQDREGRGLGVERQEQDCRTLAAKLALDIVDVYTDNDISASTRSRKPRPAYDQLLADAREGRFKTIIAYTSGRLTRRPREHEDLIELAEKHGTAFQYVASPSFDLNTSAGRRIARILAASDAAESEDIAERIRSKHRQLAASGEGSGGGTRPFGFEKDRVTVRPDEAKLIRWAADEILANGGSIHSVCRQLNQQDNLTVTGKRWTPHVARRMLMSARISGRREHHGVIVADAVWPAIISAQDSDRLRELLSDPARITNTAGNARKYLLSGFAFCGRCGTTIKARPYTNRERSYVCVSLDVGGVPTLDGTGTCGRGNLRVHAESLELYVTEAALDYLDEFIDLASAVRTGSEATRETELWDALRNYQARLEQAENAFWVDGKLTEAAFTRVSGQLKVRLAQVQDQLARLRRDIDLVSLPTSSAQARVLWERHGFDWRRRLLLSLVQRVTVGPGVRGRNKFDPDRVSITWRRPD